MIEYKSGILSQFKDIEIKWSYDRQQKTMTGYYNLETSLDIETTSTYDSGGNKIAFLYEWTIAIKDTAFYGRDVESLLSCLSDIQRYFMLSDNLRLMMFIHNLSYEFQFLRKYMGWKNVFAVDERKPIKALSDYNIEFRDSYILSGYSLAKLADNLTSHSIKKLVGDLDYSLIRHSETPLTRQELAYCESDVAIVTAYINEQIAQYGGDITRIPLTNTGRVRQYVRKNCYRSGRKNQGASRRYRDLMLELSLDTKSYLYSNKAFSGGFVHASLEHIGKTLTDVHSIDFNSSYPYCMLSEKYPMSRPYYSQSENDLLNNEYLSIIHIKFYNLQSRFTYDSYLSKHKCKTRGEIVQNGRIYCADYCETFITNVDFDIISNVYDFDYEIIDGYYFYKQYLPKQIIESILKLYNDKTLLKGVKGKEVEYMLSKGMLNSVYGMCVTAIVRDNYQYDNEWITTKPTIEELEITIEKHNKSRNRFLYYPWGPFTTSYARRNLFYGIKRIEKDYVYSDTDSIKFMNYERYKEFITDYNNECERKLKEMCDFRGIDFELCRPKGRLMGVFDYEGKSDYFKTLGAKRYMQYDKDSGYKLTVAGLSKSNGMEYIKEIGKGDIEKTFDMFNDGLIIPPNRTGKQTHTYIDSTMECDIMDYKGAMFHVKQLSGLHLSDCGFDMKIDDKFLEFFVAFQNGYISKGGYI